ncbi:MAG: prepilin peptidase [Candidatus Nomurabacteria bacterium]|jgi:leader peptidase (prepilin peptidase)/N-methyltransferase|nr:prepilin peptidase [Candidatus Nomurabacteria bacterium]
MDVFFVIWCFVFGAILGSFAVATFHRMFDDDKSKRSHCEKCGHKLGLADLVPVVSWIWLRGKCRYCGAKIGALEIIGEIAMGLLFALVYWFFPFELVDFWSILAFGLFLILSVVLMILLICDQKKQLLPVSLLTFAVICAIMYKITALVGGGTGAGLLPVLLEILWSILILSGVYFLIYKLSGERAVGSGDWILMLPMAIVLGNPVLAFSEIFLANILASLFAIIYMVVKKRKPARLPLAPFAIIAFFVIFLTQNVILGLVKNLGLL